MRGAVRALGVGAVLAAAAAAAPAGAGEASAYPRPLVSVLEVCSALNADSFPADTQNWFDPARSSQIVFFAHLLFPEDPLPDEQAWVASAPWHPPLVPPGDAPAADPRVHAYEAEWLDPNGQRIALFDLSATAQPESEAIPVSGRLYRPQTFAMAIGTRDVRGAAGQLRLPSAEGEYTVRLRVDGRSVGLAFFRMLGSAPATPKPKPDPAPTAEATPIVIPTQPILSLP